jgi:hypothetical protein
MDHRHVVTAGPKTNASDQQNSVAPLKTPLL